MDDLATGESFRMGSRSLLFVFIIMVISLAGCAIREPAILESLSTPIGLDQRVIQKIAASETEITVSGNRPFVYRVHKNGRRGLVVLLKDTYPGQYRQLIPVNKGMVTDIIPRRVVGRKGEWGTELRIGFKRFVDYQVHQKGNRLIIRLKKGKSNRSKVALIPAPNVTLNGNEAAGLLATEPSSASRSLKGETESYVIGPEDVLDVIVWKNAELSKLVSVRPDGRISLPLIGDLQAAGLTANALRDSIIDRLKEFQKVPAVSVIVQEVNSYTVFILGEVAKPGKYQLKSRLTLLQAISLAGGFTEYASRNKIKILRKRENTTQEETLEIRYKDIVSNGNMSKNLILKRGDTIIIP